MNTVSDMSGYTVLTDRLTAEEAVELRRTYDMFAARLYLAGFQITSPLIHIERKPKARLLQRFLDRLGG